MNLRIGLIAILMALTALAPAGVQAAGKDGPVAAAPGASGASEDARLGETDLIYSEKKLDDQILSFGYRTLECQLPDAIEAFGAQSINLEPGVFLHLVPCEMADLNISYYAVLETAGKFELIEFQQSSAEEENTNPSLMTNAAWDKKTGTLTGRRYYSQNMDCGSFERHRLALEEHAFYLMEYRQKDECDGRQQKPETYPLLWNGEGG